MNKTELVNSMAEKAVLTKKDAELALKAFIESVKEALKEGKKIQLIGFGTFETREQKGRTGTINFGSKKGETYTSKDKIVPVFKAGRQLKEIVDNK
ncbi:HU family DNA-binding protein (plasmid) [Clostridium botulinum]|uniref:DNA-binding protein n=2 Tax=Clostridium botulinum TaxID=1491 RepID=A0A9Q1UXA3_CLOBO|nr:HU family DNA-binding protein [Clostridium botulinum]AEB77402.1 DNA-binding protein HU1 [Clostridium botulinum BKT015925]KEH96389.1 DNA-binding protein [Clostridium botulinum C/D str. Sp77]KEH96591.1 DNA-binding protein HU1 [Clostridium botulinum D str. 16868]KGM93376.1 DNA-binding protein [Clostridium botulinum C/D str. DC5]KLU74492.1 DNA-binding protein HU1 [Clostridium botulinum V891]